MHLDGGVLREYALNMKRFSDTPFYQNGVPNVEQRSGTPSHLVRIKKPKVQPKTNPVKMDLLLSED